VRRFISSIADVRRGEALTVLLMLGLYYLILLSAYLLKPARDSIFLVHVGSRQLPIVFILTALAIGPVTSAYAAAGRSLRLTRLVYATSAVFIVGFAVMRWLLEYESTWVVYVFYVWASIFAVLSASLYWLFANAIFAPAQAKRLFVLINLGGILGAMTGGEVTSLLVSKFGVRTEDLLFFCMACVAVCAVIARVIWRLHARGGRRVGHKTAHKRERRESLRRTLSVIHSSRHLTYLVWIVALTMATASFVDFQFKTISERAFPEQGALTSFLGLFYGRLSLVSLLLQALFAYRLVRFVGVTGVVVFLPVAMLLGSGFILVAPGLLAASLLRGAQGALTHSLDKTGRELLFLPIPIEVKTRTKVFIDVFADRGARGLAGVALLLLTRALGFSVREIGVVVIALSLVWIVLVVLTRKEYVDAFRRALARRELDPSQLTANITDAATVKLLRDQLSSPNEREVVYALDMLAGSGDRSLAGDLRALLDHPSVEVRRRALALLFQSGEAPEADALAALVRDADPDVRLAALRFTARGGAGGDATLDDYLDDGDPRVAVSALRCAAEVDRGRVERGRVENLLEAAGDAEEVPVEVARALGSLSDASYRDVLLRLARNDSGRVAGEGLLAMGETGDVEFIPVLVEMLAEPGKRSYARSALADFGNAVVGQLGEILGDSEGVDMAIRRNVPVVLSRIPTQQSADALSSHLDDADASQRFRAVKALNKLRGRYPKLDIDTRAADAAFVEETRAYYENLLAATLLRGRVRGEAEALLARALDERLGPHLELMFRLLGLHYAADDVYDAYLGTVSDDKARRESAVELLDNVLPPSLKKYILPIIDPVSVEATVHRGRELFGLEAETRDDALALLIRGRDAWLRACAVYASAGGESPAVRNAVEAARHDPDPVVAETASLVAGVSREGRPL
jgi:AAA family ATP:ADP antiporter